MTTAGPSRFADLLRSYRIAAGLTQEALAERANLSVHGISNLERGRRHPYRHTLTQLADALALSPEERVRFEAAGHSPVRWREDADSELPPRVPGMPAHPTNLPDAPTPFIGREREIEQIARLLRDPRMRLMTLTGAGGTGKTRLAIQVAATVLDDFADGVFFVNLAPLADAALVPSAIAEVLGLKEESGHDLVHSLIYFLNEKHLLLVLDNYEHVLGASPLVASLLERCRVLHVLVTSRIPLHLSREHQYVVPPLAAPDPHHLPDIDTLCRIEAVALFVERARAVKADFKLTAENAAAVAEICFRLDGLPLAIELASARVKVFPPRALLQRLDSRLRLLTGGSRDQPTRQQTLRNTIDWSYSLLSSEERTLFARLSVFAGGCAIEAAETVCDPQGELDVLEILASLVDKNLLQQEGNEEPRFTMLETIREYAVERLEERDEAEQLRGQHAGYYLRLMEEGVQELYGPEQARWLDRLDEEHDNLRAALTWTRDRGDVETGLRVVSGMSHYWGDRGRHIEGQRWMREMLSVDRQDGQAPSPGARMRALFIASELVWRLGDVKQARALADEAMQLAREGADRRTLALGLRFMAWQSREEGDYGHAISLAEEGHSLYRELGDRRGIADTLLTLGDIARDQGDSAAVETYCQASLETYREQGDARWTAYCLHNLGRAAHMAGNDSRARTLYEESLRLHRRIRAADDSVEVLHSLGLLALRQRDHEEAARVFAEGLSVLRSIPPLPLRTAQLLEGMAGVAAVRQQGEPAGRLFGAADAVRTRMAASVMPVDRDLYDRGVEAARNAVGEERFTVAWNEGRSMSLQQAIAEALGADSAVSERR